MVCSESISVQAEQKERTYMNFVNVLKKLWQCERGFVVSNELVFMSAIIVLGLIVGLTTVRDQVVQEFGDVSVGVGVAR